MIPITNSIEQRQTFYVQPDTRAPDTRAPDTRAPDTRAPDTRAIGVWQIGEKIISVTKEGESLKYFEDGRAKKIPIEALGFYGRDPTPEEPCPNWSRKKIQERKLEILAARKKQLMESIFIIDRFRSIIKENLEDSIRFDGSLGLKGYLNFIPVLEGQGYIEITRRGKTRYKSLDNIRVALFGMVDPRTGTMVFARWCVLNKSTNEMQHLSIKERTSEIAFKFLKNLDINRHEKFSRNFKTILEMEDGRITNIILNCFSEADPNTIITEENGALTVIVKEHNTVPGACSTGHAMIWCEYLDLMRFEKTDRFAHLTNQEEYQGVRRNIPGGMATPTIERYIKKDRIEMKGPTWIRPIEDIKKLERSITVAMVRGQRIPFSMYSDVVDTSVASSSRGYLSYIFDGSAYLAPVAGMGIAANGLGAVCAEGYVAAGLVGGAAAGGAVLGVAAVGGYAAYKTYSYIGNYLSDKVTEWQNRDKTDDYSRNCISWVRHQLTIAGIKISVPKFNFTPKDVITHLHSNEGAVVLD